MAKLTMQARPPIMVQFANAACGPPVYMAKPKSTGMPLTKFIVVTGGIGSSMRYLES